MTDKTNESEDVIDLSSFFSKKNEEEGVWYEPVVKGRKTGVEFKMYGPNSNAVSIADEKFSKARDAANQIEDETEKAKRMDEIIAERFTGYISDIRSANGKKIVINGHPATKDDIYDIIYNSPAIALDLSKFAGRQDNFLEKKKNS